MAQAPAGWYPQPDGTQRYWDGSAWTEHISGTPTAPAATAVPEPVADVAAATKPAAKPKAAKAAAAAEGGESAVSEPVVIASSDGPGPMGGAAQPMQAAVPVASPSDLDASTPRKRKVWPIVVGVIGAIVLVVILAIVALVLVIKNATDGPNQAVADYDTAWKEVDCALMQSSTTAYFREQNGFTDCAAFESAAQDFVDGMESYDVKIYNTSIENDTAEVRTTETWTGSEAGDTSTSDYIYSLVNEGGTWRIDELVSASSE